MDTCTCKKTTQKAGPNTSATAVIWQPGCTIHPVKIS